MLTTLRRRSRAAEKTAAKTAEKTRAAEVTLAVSDVQFQPTKVGRHFVGTMHVEITNTGDTPQLGMLTITLPAPLNMGPCRPVPVHENGERPWRYPYPIVEAGRTLKWDLLVFTEKLPSGEPIACTATVRAHSTEAPDGPATTASTDLTLTAPTAAAA